MHNDLTRLLGIHVPVIGAPMAGVSATDLSAAVAKAGGIGLIGAGCMDSATLSRVYEAAIQQLRSNDEAHSAVGVGLFNYASSKVSRSGCAAIKVLHTSPSCWQVAKNSKSFSFVGPTKALFNCSAGAASDKHRSEASCHLAQFRGLGPPCSSYQEGRHQAYLPDPASGAS